MTEDQTAAEAPPGVLTALRDCIRAHHYSLRTERTYVHWVRRFLVFHGRRSLRELGAAEVTAFLNHLATREGCVEKPVCAQMILARALCP